jgi:hypothetical protein
MSDQLKPVTHYQQTYLTAIGGNCGGIGPIALHVPALIPMIRMVINIKRIALLRITFSPSELSRPPIEPAVIFFLHWARENQQGDKGAEPKGRESTCCGDFIAY